MQTRFNCDIPPYLYHPPPAPPSSAHTSADLSRPLGSFLMSGVSYALAFFLGTFLQCVLYGKCLVLSSCRGLC